MGPLAAGQHKLDVTLNFGVKRRVGGGPEYSFKFNFNREFYVVSGKTTVVDLIGLPKDGFKNGLNDAKLARAKSRIIANDSPEFFPNKSCSEMAKSGE